MAYDISLCNKSRSSGAYLRAVRPVASERTTQTTQLTIAVGGYVCVCLQLDGQCCAQHAHNWPIKVAPSDALPLSVTTSNERVNSETLKGEQHNGYAYTHTHTHTHPLTCTSFLLYEKCIRIDNYNSTETNCECANERVPVSVPYSLSYSPTCLVFVSVFGFLCDLERTFN